MCQYGLCIRSFAPTCLYQIRHWGFGTAAQISGIFQTINRLRYIRCDRRSHGLDSRHQNKATGQNNAVSYIVFLSDAAVCGMLGPYRNKKDQDWFSREEKRQEQEGAPSQISAWSLGRIWRARKACDSNIDLLLLPQPAPASVPLARQASRTACADVFESAQHIFQHPIHVIWLFVLLDKLNRSCFRVDAIKISIIYLERLGGNIKSRENLDFVRP